MLNKNIRKILLFLTLCVLFIGIASATDTDSIEGTDTTYEISATPNDTQEFISENNNDVKDNNEINKIDNIEKSVKTTTNNTDGQKYTYIELNNINDIAYDDYTYITGHYYYGNNIPLTYTPMKIYTNGELYDTVKTDNYGYFSCYYMPEKVFKNSVTVSYHGNKNFKAATATTSFQVKITSPISTYIDLFNVEDVEVGEYTTISGYYFYANNQPLTQTNMRININGQTYTAKTDNYGYFTYNYKTTKTGTNTIIVSYPGNTNFQTSTNTKTFNVKSTGPQETYIILNSIKEVINGQTTTISGHYYYGNNIPLTYTNMWININGQTYKTKTDNNGYFTYNYKTNKEGSNTVTVSYPGNKNFKAANTSKTFNVKADGPQDTYIILNDIHDITYDDYAVIDGYYFYGNNIPLTYTPMTISVNGRIIEYAKTDNKGYFSCEYWPAEVFKNTVTVSYHGNKNFKAATATKTFNVKTTRPIITYVDINEIDKVEVGKYTTISGYYSYGNGVPLKQTTMRININGQQYTAKTDNKGYFTYNYKTNKSGTNSVTVSYPGNTNFLATSSTKSFKVSEPIYTIELDTPLLPTNDFAIKNVDGDIFVSWYQTYDGQELKGVQVHTGGFPDDIITTPHLLTDAIFYFKNSAGNIITRQYDDGRDGWWMKHDLINGYTPYKVLVKYRRITQEEIDLRNNGYEYDPKTDEWYYRNYDDEYY